LRDHGLVQPLPGGFGGGCGLVQRASSPGGVTVSKGHGGLCGPGTFEFVRGAGDRWSPVAGFVVACALDVSGDLRTVMKGVLRDHLGVPAGALDESVFPGSVAARPMDGLIRG